MSFIFLSPPPPPRRIRVGQVYVDQLSVPNRPVLIRIPWTFTSDQKDCSGTLLWRRATAAFMNSQINSRVLGSGHFILLLWLARGQQRRSSKTALSLMWLMELLTFQLTLSSTFELQGYFLGAWASASATCALSLILFLAQVEQSKVLVKEGSVQLLLTIVDTPGFGDAVDNSNW